MLRRVAIPVVMRRLPSCCARQFRHVSDVPAARSIPAAHLLHDQMRYDDYAWLHDASDAAVQRHLQLEQEYCDEVLDALPYVKDSFMQRSMAITECVAKQQQRTRDLCHGYAYYSKTDSAFPAFFRHPIGKPGQEELLMDLNQLHEKFVDMGMFRMSPCQRFIAYTIDTSGSELYRIMVKDLQTGKDVNVGITRAVSIEWTAQQPGDPQSAGFSFLYTEADDNGRPFRLRLHSLGSGLEDPILFEEPDQARLLDITATKNKKFLLLSSSSKATSHVMLIPAKWPHATQVSLLPRVEGTEYFVEHCEDHFLVVRAVGDLNFELLALPVPQQLLDLDSPPPCNPRTIEPARQGPVQMLIAARSDTNIQEMDVFAGYVVLYEICQGRPRVMVTCKSSGLQHQVTLPAELGCVVPGSNQDYNSDVVNLTFSSPLIPEQTLQYDMKQQTLTALVSPSLQDVVLDLERDFVCERLEAVSPDGTLVPVTVVRRANAPQSPKDKAPPRKPPLLLMAYGAYGTCLDLSFQPWQVSMLLAGWRIAFAHIRGGGELGRGWWAAGRGVKKAAGAQDLVAVTEMLQATGLCTPATTAVSGTSAGAVAVAGSLVSHPQLFKAALLKMPFVDCVGCMVDPSLPLTVHERDEWGDPLHCREDYDAMLTWSPYEILRPQKYPATLVTTSVTDMRVPFWGPAKFCAKLRAMQEGTGPIVLHTDLDKGHFSEAGMYGAVEGAARDYVFLNLAMKHSEPDRVQDET